MAYANPTVPIPPNPVFIDKAIAELQTVLSTVGWLTHCFGRSYIKEDVNGKSPMVYKGGAEYLPVQFNDNLQGQSFFEVGTQEVYGEWDEFLLNSFKVPISLVVWANLKKIDSTKGNVYYFAEQLKKDVREVLRDVILLESKIRIESIEENINRIFENYTFEQINKQYFTYPYVGFRFNMELIIVENC